MTEKEILNLFFRYEKSKANKYTDVYLTNALHYLPKYSKLIKKKNKAFIELMEDIPRYIYDYYENYLEKDPDLMFIIKKIKRTDQKDYINPIINRFGEYIKEEKTNYRVNYIGEKTLLVSIPKKNMKFSYVDDLLITFDNREFKKIELLNEYKISKEGINDKIYKESLIKFENDLNKFKEKNKIQILIN